MFSDRQLARCGAWAVAFTALALLVGGCSSDGTGNAAPTLSVDQPAADSDVQVGATVSIVYTDNDADDDAVTDLYADIDGNLATTNDQIVIATGRVDQDGTAQTLTWNTAGVPEGSYFIVGRTDDSTNGGVTDTCPGKVNVWNLWPQDHTNIILRDVAGDPIALGSDEPYSPRQTCGQCHDVDAITNGYHFQQGRTDATATVQMADDFFGDGRTWLKSDGMYGKW